MHNYYNGIHIHKFSKGVKYTFYISAILSFNVTIIFIDMTHKTKKLEHNISHPSNSLLFCIYDRFHNLVHTKFPFLFNLFSTMHLKILHTMLMLLQLYFFHMLIFSLPSNNAFQVFKDNKSTNGFNLTLQEKCLSNNI